MPASGNNPEREPEGLDNAYVSSPRFAELQDRPVDKVIHEPYWHGPNTPDFHHRTVISGEYSLPYLPEVPRTVPAPPSVLSDSSSMSVGLTAETLSSRFSSRTPSLSSGSSFSGSSARTSAAGSVSGYARFDEEGTSEESANHVGGSWPCIFQFLGCARLCDDAYDWQTHYLSHFRGQPPSSVQCPFGCYQTVSGSGAEDICAQLWNHVRSFHEHGGTYQYRPDSKLINHLWRTRVINSAEEQELRENGSLASGTRPYLQVHSSGRRRDRNGWMENAGCG